jgi:GTP-binding protein
MKIQKIEFIGSFPRADDCPQNNFPEYAFIGRSNVGKSSLINAITGRKEVAKTSKKPGKTQMINIFLVDKAWYIADLPGYGFAHVSKSKRRKWERMLEDYVLFRPNLVCAFVLIDVRHELQKNDLDFINWLGERHIPFCLIFTKADKLKVPALEGNVDQIKNSLLEFWSSLPESFITSSITRDGVANILDYIRSLNDKIWHQQQIENDNL